jgi:hypothetical protein
MIQILPRESWGFTGWQDVATWQKVAPPLRDRFMVHWDGDVPVRDLGPATLRRIDHTHRSKGWAGIGYNFVIDAAARVWEGRGWSRRGAHCTGMNTRAIGVQLAIGAGQRPSEGMLRALSDLHAEAVSVYGHDLAWTWHAAHYATACPGPDLINWIQRGRPLTSRGEEMTRLSKEDLRAIADELFSSADGEDGARYRVKDGVGPDGQPVLLGLTDAGTRQLALLREINAKLDGLHDRLSE